MRVYTCDFCGDKMTIPNDSFFAGEFDFTLSRDDNAADICYDCVGGLVEEIEKWIEKKKR